MSAWHTLREAVGGRSSLSWGELRSRGADPEAVRTWSSGVHGSPDSFRYTMDADGSIFASTDDFKDDPGYGWDSRQKSWYDASKGITR